jgi:hypothetical protein
LEDDKVDTTGDKVDAVNNKFIIEDEKADVADDKIDAAKNKFIIDDEFGNSDALYADNLDGDADNLDGDADNLDEIKNIKVKNKLSGRKRANNLQNDSTDLQNERAESYKGGGQAVTAEATKAKFGDALKNYFSNI